MISPFKTALLLSYICIASISAAIITPALPYIKESFDLSKGSVQWVVSIFLMGYVLGQLIYAPLANRFGRLNALRTGLVINLMGIVICLLSTHFNSFSILISGRLISALGAASGLACTFMLLNELLLPDKAKHAMSFTVVAFTLGIGLSVLIGSLVTEYLRWQDCFWVLLFHGIIMFMLTWQFPETLKIKTPIRPTTIARNYLSAFQSSRLIIFSFIAASASVFSYGFSVAAPMYTQLQLHLSPSEYGYWNILNMVGMLASGFLSAYLMKKIGEKRVVQFGLTCIFPGLIACVLLIALKIDSVLYFFILTTYFYLMTGLLFPAASYFASNAIIDKANASSAMSFINVGFAMLSVIVVGYLPFQEITSFVVTLCVFFSMVMLLAIWQLRASQMEKYMSSNNRI